jgi:hypothetical protein
MQFQSDKPYYTEVDISDSHMDDIRGTRSKNIRENLQELVKLYIAPKDVCYQAISCSRDI